MDLPEPNRVRITESGNRTYGVMVTGIGGTGVVTIGQLIGMAAHLEGLGISVLDMAGLAQKGGAVFSHVQIAPTPEDLHSTRIATGEADLLIGCDLVVSAGNEALSKMRPRVTRAVINGDVLPTSDFLRDPDWTLPAEGLKRNVLDAAGEIDIDFFEANTLAVALLGDAIYANPMLLGYAWQKGWVPLTRQSIERAIELNAVAVSANQDAFNWGRCIAHDAEAVRKVAGLRKDSNVIELRRGRAQSDEVSGLDALIERRVAFLTAYQDARWARRYADWVERVRRVESDRMGAAGGGELTEAIARNLFKLMAYKDEYEVARLHSDPAFVASIRERFEGDWTLKFHLAAPLLSRVDPRTGVPTKREYGSWMLTAMRWLARLRFLRGSALDPFGRTAERRTERALIGEYEALIDTLLAGLDQSRHELAVELAGLPEHIRGFGHVKERHLASVRTQWEQGLSRWRGDAKAVRRVPIPIRSA
jgi:indolepyruvate ferredoxin oxidoreductase